MLAAQLMDPRVVILVGQPLQDVLEKRTEAVVILIDMAQAFAINYDALKNKFPRLFEQPFDANRKRMIHSLSI